MKKIISAGLATILAASALSTAAFADEFTITAESVLAKPAIKVTMPKSMAFVFNPYGLQVTAKGAIDTTNGKTGTLIGSYAYETTDNTGWTVANTTGTALKAAVYAYTINKDGAEFAVIDKSGTLPTGAKRSLKVALTAKGDDDAAAVALKTAKLDTKTNSIWDDENGATIIDSVTDKLIVAFDNENSVAAKAETDVWSEKDAVKINFIFAFELAEGGSEAVDPSEEKVTITFKKSGDNITGLDENKTVEVTKGEALTAAAANGITAAENFELKFNGGAITAITPSANMEITVTAVRQKVTVTFKKSGDDVEGLDEDKEVQVDKGVALTAAAAEGITAGNSKTLKFNGGEITAITPTADMEITVTAVSE